jgi:hypothetical protein
LRPPDERQALAASSHSTRDGAAVLLGGAFALGSATLGLAALGAASLGHLGLRIPGFVLLAVGGATAAAFRWRKERYDLDREAVAYLATAQEQLAEGDHTAAAVAATKAARSARTSRTRNAGLTTVAWAALGQGFPERAKAALDRIEPSHAVDLGCLAAVESARGKPERAIEALEVARTAGSLTRDGAKLLVDCYVRRCGIDRAVMAALQTRKALGAENCRMVVQAASAAGAHAAAAILASAIGGDVRAVPSVTARTPG